MEQAVRPKRAMPHLAAVAAGHADEVRLLLEGHQDSSVPRMSRKHALFEAAENGRTAVVERLLVEAGGAGLDLNATCKGVTPLFKVGACGSHRVSPSPSPPARVLMMVLRHYILVVYQPTPVRFRARAVGMPNRIICQVPACSNLYSDGLWNLCSSGEIEARC